MADSTATITVFPYPAGVTETSRTEVLRGTIKFSQGHYPVAGWALNWGALPGIKAIPPGNQFPSSTGSIMPIDLDCKSTSVPPSGIVYMWDNVTGNLHAYITADAASNASGPLIEFGGAAIPGWMFNDIVQFRAEFARI